ncbi:MAG: glutamate synthase subunit alpha [Methanomassiliicoccales archaeon PtaU1.Bin124]|nr:MAG: glutamate synthase subunit alpha [Methanomassiliicoccales archaeon PtaU1.Bin124]
MAVYKRYHIHTEEALPRVAPVGKFDIVRAENCVNCGTCIRSCVYGVHKRDEKDGRSMAEPLSHLCKNCFRCLMECPQRALSMSPGKVYNSLGIGVWSPQRVFTMWNEAQSGKIPVFGAGYRGRFSGPGFDGMWTDMSEIVRPTRDGIHGREYISTSMSLGRKLRYLEFDQQGRLQTAVPHVIELPLPMVLDATRLGLTDESLKGMVSAAAHIGTFILVPVEKTGLFRGEEQQFIVPVLLGGTLELSLPESTRMVEIRRSPGWESLMRHVKSARPDVLVSVRLNAGKDVESEVLQIAKAGADIVHLDFGEDGKEAGNDGRWARDALRSIHTNLVRNGHRDQITILAGGGIAAAEHVPKSIICGADCIVLEKALKVALGCHACPDCKMTCPADLKTAPSDWVEKRVTNMVGAWRDQLLEVMGAMGIREVRRLRGEQGRAIFYEDAERDAFAGITAAERSG